MTRNKGKKMWKLLVLLVLMCVVRGEPDDRSYEEKEAQIPSKPYPDPNKQYYPSQPPPEDPLIMEAQFISYNSSAGPDEMPRLEWMERTKRNYPRILNKAMMSLMGHYCRSLAYDLVVFGNEHAEGFGVNNVTVPNFDVYDVAQRILLAYENLAPEHPAFAAVNHSIVSCKKSETERSGIPARQQPLWILGCVTNQKQVDLEVLSRADVRTLWHVSVTVDGALEHLHEILRCPQLISRLAHSQLKAEYLRDGVHKAHAAKAISEERREYLLGKLRSPTLGDIHRQMVRVSLEMQQKRREEMLKQQKE
jgi:hypothetical protein